MNRLEKVRILTALAVVAGTISLPKRKEHRWIINAEKINAVCEVCHKVIDLENFDEFINSPCAA